MYKKTTYTCNECNGKGRKRFLVWFSLRCSNCGGTGDLTFTEWVPDEKPPAPRSEIKRAAVVEPMRKKAVEEDNSSPFIMPVAIPVTTIESYSTPEPAPAIEPGGGSFGGGGASGSWDSGSESSSSSGGGGSE